MPPFVLLHGAGATVVGVGPGCPLSSVTPVTTSYTPTCTGLGERAHLLSPDIGLSTHIQDLVNVFEFEDIEDAILVAHSYGGVVASGAMELIHHRVRSLVFLDALLTRGGETVPTSSRVTWRGRFPRRPHEKERVGISLPPTRRFMASQTPPTPCGSTAS